ncbi:alpha/beta fold hydrolase [Pseudomonas fluorescens]|jgi:pimeloyl-[acyl-carrier protein] methyl ester esterase|uniref:Alpha/beta fold hydrolase n=1 Tax=Pseudomonas fluorescens TaxID=294 RepID=A0A4Y9TJ41_PSEFL|nr:alpha/beta fold hydrolase [Pseudomonas fluorescens]TFW42416.1 alpha/beta fold hydrolase [Pseudomonas fluorescens]
MRNRLVLLPGWGLGVSPLEPLAAALQGLDEHLHVQIEPLPALGSCDLEEWLDELDATLPDNTWLGGWSLGGMLAAELAARRGERCCGLLTLASNPCFVAHEGWPDAMPAETFDAFLSGCHADSQVTLKRFGLLCAKGAADPRGLSRLLVSGAPHTAPHVLMPGLELLAQLDTREALLAYRGPQLHLFAAMDALVPAQAASALLALLPDVEIGLIEQAGHAFLLEDPHGVAGAIQAFLHECVDD